MKRHYADAVQVQNACNLCGVAQSFAAALVDVYEEARRLGLGTDYVNRHPIARLYADKIAALNGVALVDYGDNPDSFSAALRYCEDRSK